MSKPRVSILVATYNRSRLLRRALASILAQDFVDYEVVVVNDNSTDDTAELLRSIGDPRIRHIQYSENVGSKFGDRNHFHRFIYEYSKGDYLVYLCDDDWWIPDELLSRQVQLLDEQPSLAMVIGGQVQLFPSEMLSVSADVLERWQIMDPGDLGIRRGVAAGSKAQFRPAVFPQGHMRQMDFLQRFADDPAGCNIVGGAIMFRRSAMERANVLRDPVGSRWQAGYELVVGTATAGDVYYLDEPCVASLTSLESASFRGGQLAHMFDCLRSIDIAFTNGAKSATPERQSEFADLKMRMMHAVIFNYISNKLYYRLGSFSTHFMKDIEGIFKPEIPHWQFRRAIERCNVPLSLGNRFFLFVSNFNPDLLRRFWFTVATPYGGDWCSSAYRFPSPEMNKHLLRSVWNASRQEGVRFMQRQKRRVDRVGGTISRLIRKS